MNAVTTPANNNRKPTGIIIKKNRAESDCLNMPIKPSTNATSVTANPIQATNLPKRCTQSMPGFGGARRDRTADLLHAMQALSQLSYSPEKGSA